MLKIEGFSKHYGNFTAVDGIDIHLEKGKFLTILGPSGSGKTTTLMSVAGFVIPDAGRIYVDGKDITKVRPYKRNIGMVFQSYALFPHMTVFQNIMYPLKMRHISKTECEQKAKKYLGIVGLEDFGHRYPKELSGGQQQRVALARALVFDPPLLLMDEPLGALDKQLRQRMQLEIKHIQKSLDITVVYVTHDQEEALTMSDEVIIMNHGRIEQHGTPWQLYENPRNTFVAEFMGESNLIKAQVIKPAEADEDGIAVLDNHRKVRFQTAHRLREKDSMVISVRPEHIELSLFPTEGGLEGEIEEIIYLGESTRYKVRLTDSSIVLAVKVAKLKYQETERMRESKKIYVSWPSESGVVIV